MTVAEHGSFPTWDTLRALEAEVATLRAQRDQVLALCSADSDEVYVRSDLVCAVFGADPPAEPACLPLAHNWEPVYDAPLLCCHWCRATKPDPQRTETPR